MAAVNIWFSRLPVLVSWLISFAFFIILAILIIVMFANRRRTVGWLCTGLAIYSVLVGFTFNSLHNITDATLYTNPLLAMFNGFFEVLLMFLNPRDYHYTQGIINETPFLSSNAGLQAIFWSSQVTARLATHLLIVFLFGKKFIDSIRIRMFWRLRLFKIKEVYIILGGGNDSLSLGEDLYRNCMDKKTPSAKRLIIFLTSDAKDEKNIYEKAAVFGGIVRVLDSKKYNLEYYLCKTGLAALKDKTKRRLKLKIFLMPNDVTAADRILEIAQIAEKYGVKENSDSFDIYLITSSDWIKDKVIGYLSENNWKVKYKCHIIDEIDLLIRTQIIKKHPPVKCPGLGFVDKNYSKNGKAKREFTVMIVGFKKRGQRALMHLIMNGQFVCDEVGKDNINMRAIVVERNAPNNLEGFRKHVPELDLCCRIEAKNINVPSEEFSLLLSNEHESIDYIVIALDKGEFNRYAARYIEKYYQNEGKTDSIPYIAVYDKDWVSLQDGEKPEDNNERIFRFGCREILFTEKTILRAEQDRIAKLFSKEMHPKRTWNDLSFYAQEEYRALADFYDSMLILMGENLEKFNSPSDVFLQTEHLRWSAFRIVARGYRTMSENDMIKRFYENIENSNKKCEKESKKDCKNNCKDCKFFNCLKYAADDRINKQHARLVQWGEVFNNSSNSYRELSIIAGYSNSNGFQYYLEKNIKSIPLITLALAEINGILSKNIK